MKLAIGPCIVALIIVFIIIAVVVQTNDIDMKQNKNEVKKGIGLTNISSRVALLKGEMTIDSAPNEGTTFTIEIPIP